MALILVVIYIYKKNKSCNYHSDFQCINRPFHLNRFCLKINGKHNFAILLYLLHFLIIRWFPRLISNWWLSIFSDSSKTYHPQGTYYNRKTNQAQIWTQKIRIFLRLFWFRRTVYPRIQQCLIIFSSRSNLTISQASVVFSNCCLEDWLFSRLRIKTNSLWK